MGIRNFIARRFAVKVLDWADRRVISLTRKGGGDLDSEEYLEYRASMDELRDAVRGKKRGKDCEPTSQSQ